MTVGFACGEKQIITQAVQVDLDLRIRLFLFPERHDPPLGSATHGARMVQLRSHSASTGKDESCKGWKGTFQSRNPFLDLRSMCRNDALNLRPALKRRREIGTDSEE